MALMALGMERSEQVVAELFRKFETLQLDSRLNIGGEFKSCVKNITLMFLFRLGVNM